MCFFLRFTVRAGTQYHGHCQLIYALIHSPEFSGVCGVSVVHESTASV